ncbi:MAG: flagellar biosynthetic protein FliO [Deltaproteobacteria bacterium]|nr:flagellar biosynthetic protein FliO [Deltaproteobacteria bacterium]
MKVLHLMLGWILALTAGPQGLWAATPSPTPLALGDPAAEFGAASVDFTWLFLKMVFAMIFVIALAIVVIRFIIPKLTFNRGAAARSDLRIVDRVPLDARKSLYILQVEGRRLLIGSSEHHVGLIAELKAVRDDDDDDDEA